MPATTEHKAEIVKAHARSAADTGSTEVQVALLTDRINEEGQRFFKAHGFFESKMIPMRLLLARENTADEA